MRAEPRPRLRHPATFFRASGRGVEGPGHLLSPLFLLCSLCVSALSSLLLSSEICKTTLVSPITHKISGGFRSCPSNLARSFSPGSRSPSPPSPKPPRPPPDQNPPPLITRPLLPPSTAPSSIPPLSPKKLRTPTRSSSSPPVANLLSPSLVPGLPSA